MQIAADDFMKNYNLNVPCMLSFFRPDFAMLMGVVVSHQEVARLAKAALDSSTNAVIYMSWYFSFRQ